MQLVAVLYVSSWGLIVRSERGVSAAAAENLRQGQCLTCGHFATDVTHLTELRDQHTRTTELITLRRDQYRAPAERPAAHNPGEPP